MLVIGIDIDPTLDYYQHLCVVRESGSSGFQVGRRIEIQAATAE